LTRKLSWWSKRDNRENGWGYHHLLVRERDA